MRTTAAATAANVRRGLEKMADRLRAAGWTVTPPAGDVPAGPRRVEFKAPLCGPLSAPVTDRPPR